MVKEEFFRAIPPSYWAEHPDAVMADGRVAMSAGGLLVRRGDHRVADRCRLRPSPRDHGMGGDQLRRTCWRPSRRWGTAPPTSMSWR